MERFEANWYMSQKKNSRLVTRKEVLRLMSTVETLQKEDEDLERQEDLFIFGIPDKVLSRKQ